MYARKDDANKPNPPHPEGRAARIAKARKKVEQQHRKTFEILKNR